MLSLDIVPRDENGVPINSKTAGVMQLYKVVSILYKVLHKVETLYLVETSVKIGDVFWISL